MWLFYHALHQIDVINLNKMKKQMNQKFALIPFVAVFAIAMFGVFACAAYLDDSPYVEIDGLAANNNNAVVAGDMVPVTVDFMSGINASEVVVSAWIQGSRSDRVEKEFADLIDGSVYRARLSVEIPSNIDPDEELTLYVRIETDEGNWEESYILKGQRESNNLYVLLAEFDSSAEAGATLPMSIVLKNMGRHESEDTLVTVRITELGVSKTVWFEDLFPEDNWEEDDDNENAREKKVFLTIPSSANAGVYEVEIVAENEDTKTSIVKSLVVTKESVEGKVLANPSSQTFAVNEKATYQLLLVNSGDEIAIYNIVPQQVDGLSVSVSDTVVIVPAGSSKTVDVFAKASREGTFGFAVTASSEDFTKTANYVATVEGKSISGGSNNIVALTIVLAIIFVVLVVILIVLLTRKPEKSEEFSESYY